MTDELYLCIGMVLYVITTKFQDGREYLTLVYSVADQIDVEMYYNRIFGSITFQIALIIILNDLYSCN